MELLIQLDFDNDNVMNDADVCPDTPSNEEVQLEGERMGCTLEQRLALGEFDDPEVKKAVIEIAHSKDYPIDIRKKAIDNLAAFNDPSILNGLLPMLEIKENYIYYDNIINMVYSLGEEKKNAELVRRMAFKAHYTKREHD